MPPATSPHLFFFFLPKCVFPFLPSSFFPPSKGFESISCPTNAVYPLGCETSAVCSPRLLELFLARRLTLAFFFASLGKKRKKKGDFIKTLVAAQHPVWERSIACDVPPKKKKKEKQADAHWLPASGGDGRGDARTVENFFCNCNLFPVFSDYWACLQLCSFRLFFLLFLFFFRGTLFLKSEETLPSKTIPTIWKPFMKYPHFSRTSNKPGEKSAPARWRASHFHFFPLVPATVPGAVGFKVILKGL